MIVCTAIWGTTFVLMKIALNFTDFTTFVTLRFGLATAFMAMFCVKKFMLFKFTDIKYGSALGVLLFGGIIFQVWALKYTSASNVALMYTFYIILVPFLSSFFLRKMPSVSSILGVVIAIGYAVQIIFQKNTNPTHAVIIFSLESLFGVVFAMLIPGIDGETEIITQNTIWGCLCLSTGFIISQFNFVDKVILMFRSRALNKSKQIT